MMRSKKFQLVIAIAGLVTMAGKLSTQSTPDQQRRFQRGMWSSVLNTDLASLSFGDIEMLDFDRDVIVTYDYADHKVKGIDRRGTLVWAVGGQGSLLENLGPMLIGVAVGLLGSLAASRLLVGLLSGVNPTDPIVLLAVALILVVSGMLATLRPALEAARVDPVVALRTEA